MRKIKFRAWDKSRKEMEYINNMYWFEENGVDDINNNVFLDFMQYTGLKDMNGKEIFEGDILTSKEYPFQDDGEYNYHGVVEWGEEEAAYYLTKHLANKNRRGISHGISEMLGQEDMSTFEIIGNIYENPELMEIN